MRLVLNAEEWITLEGATEKFGYEGMDDMLHEEHAELVIAMNHKKRGRTDHNNDIIEELADNFVVLSQKAQSVGLDKVMEIATLKLERLKIRVANNNPIYRGEK